MQLIQRYRLHIIFLCLLLLFMVYERLLLIGSYSIDLDGLEYMFIHYIQNVLAHKPLYCATNSYPFDTNIHMPMYPYLMAGIFKLSGITGGTGSLHDHDIYRQLIICRIISFLFLVVSSYYLVKIVRLFNKAFYPALFTVTFFMLFLTGHFYAARQDAIKTSFFIMLVYHTLNYILNGRRMHFFAMVLFCILSVSAKQDTIIYIILFSLVSVYVYRSKLSVGICLLFVLLFVLIIACCSLLFGYKFIENTLLLNLQVNVSNINTYNFYALLFSVGRTLPVLILLVLLHRKHSLEVNKLPALKVIIYFAYASYLCSHILIFRASSYINYTHEAMAFAVLSIAILLQYQPDQKRIIRFTFVFGTLTLFSSMLIHTYFSSPAKQAASKDKYESLIRHKCEIDTIIGQDCTFFLTSDHTIFFHERNLLYGYDLHMDQFVYAYLGFKTHSRLLFSDSKFYDTYFERNVKYIITSERPECREIMRKNFRRYLPYKQAGDLLIYRMEKSL